MTGDKIANGAVSINKLARPVRTALAKAGESHGTVSGAQGPGGPQGPQGRRGRPVTTARTARMAATVATV